MEGEKRLVVEKGKNRNNSKRKWQEKECESVGWLCGHGSRVTQDVPAILFQMEEKWGIR